VPKLDSLPTGRDHQAHAEHLPPDARRPNAHRRRGHLLHHGHYLRTAGALLEALHLWRRQHWQEDLLPDECAGPALRSGRQRRDMLRAPVDLRQSPQRLHPLHSVLDRERRQVGVCHGLHSQQEERPTGTRPGHHPQGLPDKSLQVSDRLRFGRPGRPECARGHFRATSGRQVTSHTAAD